MSISLNNLKFGRKLALAFGITMVALVGFGLFAINRMDAINATSTDIETNWLPSVGLLGKINSTAGELRIEEGTHIATTDEKAMAQLENEMHETGAKLADERKEYEKLISSDEEKKLYGQFSQAWEAYLLTREDVLTHSRKNDNAVANQLYVAKDKENFVTAIDALEKDVALNTKGGVDASHRGDEIFAQSQHVTYLVLVGTMLLVIGAMFVLIKAIASPLRKLALTSGEFAQGNYKVVIGGLERHDEVGELAQSLDKFKSIAADFSGQIDAIGKSQAVISFNMDGTIIDANPNFLNALGYTFDEIKGKHHSMFVEPAFKNSNEYAQFWDALRHGQYQAAEYKRIGKAGREVWIQASYNPIFDPSGKPFKIVKYATDVTLMVTTRIENEMGMNEAVRVLTGVAAGNLTQKMDLEYKGTFADIKKAVNATVDRLYGMVRQIIEAAQSVNSAATEIASGSTDLSQRTEEQASSLEETAASMEQITGTVKQNSQNANTANDLSSKANTVASDGGKVVEEAVSAMGSIEKSSKKISDIIGVIDEIAFQTNLLALNAAVEAARAGDAGKGFAVVASEVRSLAGRSASASKEIKALINESATQVQSGAALVNQAGETLKNIVASVKQVSGIVSEIASASQEQATGIDEINTAITQMDEVTQQNAALVEENTAAATSMVEQARELEKLMSFFTLDDDGSESAEQTSGEAEKIMERRSPNSPLRKVGAKPAIVKSSAKPATLANGKAKPAMRPGAKPAKAANAGYDKDWQEF